MKEFSDFVRASNSSDFAQTPTWNDAVSLVGSMPSAQQEPRWIPCSERLPEKSGRYLVTNTRLGAFEVTWNIFYNGKGEAPEGWLYEDGTIAWMPLPEPYKGEES